MLSVSARSFSARALALLLAVLLAVTGFSLPAFATDAPDTVEAPVTEPTEAPAPDAPADEPTEPAEEPTEPDPEPTATDPAVDEGTEPRAGRSAAPRVAGAEPAGPTLTVSRTTGLDAAGDTVTVTGAGYNPAQAMYLLVCRDVPLEDVNWAFALGCTSGSKQISPNPTTATQVKLEADGTFTTTFSVSKNVAFTNGTALYTVSNHTAPNDRSQDAKQVISFTPLLTVTPATDLDPSGATITVTGSGYDPAQGMYLMFCRQVGLGEIDWNFALGCTAGSKLVSPNPTSATQVKLEADGTFTTTLAIAANPAHTAGSAIYTAANHTAPNNRAQDARRIVTFASPIATTTTLDVAATAVAGADVPVTVTVDPIAAGTVTLAGAGADRQAAVDPESGEASFTLSAIEAGSYSLTATFVPDNAAVFAGSSDSATLTVTAPVTGPTLTVSRTTGLDAAGDTVTVTGAGYNPAQAMYLLVCRDVPLEEVNWSFALGCTSGSKQISPNPTTATQVKLEADGTFTTTFSVSKNVAFTSGTALYTVSNHTAPNDRSQDAKQAISFTPLLTVTPATDLDPSGATVTVTGSGYDPNQGMYLMFCRQVGLAEINWDFALGCTAGSKLITPNPTTATQVKLEADGTFTTTLTIAANPAHTAGSAIYTAANHTAPNNRAQDARRIVTFAAAEATTTTITAPSSVKAGRTVTVDVAIAPATAGTVTLTGAGDAQEATVDGTAGTASFTLRDLAAGEYTLTATFAPANPAVRAGSVATATLQVKAPLTKVGSLRWGVKADFRAYVTGPIAQGSITTIGATNSGGVFGFTQTGGSLDVDGRGTVSYGGGVRFTGHHGELDLTLSDPRVRIDSANSGTLLVRVDGGAHRAFATLALGSGNRTEVDGVVTYSGVPATLTAAGAADFQGFYAAGDALDPVTFVVGAAGSVNGGTSTVAFVAPEENTPDATPPATEGVESEQTEFTAGGQATFRASGFQPRESGILAVIYSEPTLLADDLTADADGAVTWTGALPVGLTGRHTFTFQGSVDRGIVIEIAEAAVVGCVIEGAELDWGFKESFRAYLDGSVANGEWTASDGATYETPLFSWANGRGGFDAATGDADIAFTGSVRFTGHGGVLDTTVSNPRVVISGDRAVLILDVSGTTQSGETVDAPGVEFAELDLAAAEVAGGGDLVAYSGIPAVLTAAGSAAFGTYPAGEELDPIDLRITVDPACAQPAAVDSEPTAVTPEPVAEASPLPWILAGLALLLVVALVVTVLVRRRRTA